MSIYFQERMKTYWMQQMPENKYFDSKQSIKYTRIYTDQIAYVSTFI